MDIKKARGRLEEIGLDIDTIEEVLPLILSEQEPVTDGFSALRQEEQALRASLSDGDDWRRKASAAARIISINLEA